MECYRSPQSPAKEKKRDAANEDSRKLKKHEDRKRAGIISRLLDARASALAIKRRSTTRPAVRVTRFLLLGPPTDRTALNSRRGA